MIKYDGGGCEFSGTKIDFISELTVIMKRMVEKGVLDDYDIDLLVKTVKMPREDIQAENKKLVENMSEFDKLLMKLFTGIDANKIVSMEVDD
jgi:hypothetical protein